MRSTTPRRSIALTLALFAAACAPAPSPDAEPAVGGADAASAEVQVGAPLADPQEYLRVHNIASDTEADGWRGAIEILARAGDAFTLKHLGRIDQARLSGADTNLLASARTSISERLLEKERTIGADRVVAHLERAAYADLMCDDLEGPLKNWTFEAVKAELHDPAVLAELRRLESDYTPSVNLKTSFSSMSKRVPGYAHYLLESAPKNED